MDDARLNVALATTAAGAGAAVMNYVSVVSLIKARRLFSLQPERIASACGGSPTPPPPPPLSPAACAGQDAAGKVVGATCVDNETGAKFDVRAKCVVNAAGPFCDGVRKMGQADARPMITPSSGVHLTLPGYFRRARSPAPARCRAPGPAARSRASVPVAPAEPASGP